jgi:hypothetical protein
MDGALWKPELHHLRRPQISPLPMNLAGSLSKLLAGRPLDRVAQRLRIGRELHKPVACAVDGFPDPFIEADPGGGHRPCDSVFRYAAHYGFRTTSLRPRPTELASTLPSQLITVLVC